MNAKPDSIHAVTMDGAKIYRGISFVNARMAMNPTLMVIIVGISTNALAKMKKFVLRQVIEKMILLHIQNYNDGYILYNFIAPRMVWFLWF